MTQGETVCVTGASGFVGSWLVMRLLERGYTVRATVRDPSNEKKVKHLLDLTKASSHLTLWTADLQTEGSFDEAVQGCTGVFHVASPTEFNSQDPDEVIQPAINGVLNVMRSCIKAKTVRRIVCTSSAGAVSMAEKKRLVYDETCWSDADFCRSVKMPGYMYFLSKTLSEQAAWKFAEENNLDLVTVISTLVVGPFAIPTIPASLLAALAPIAGNDNYYKLLKECHFVHPDHLCNAHIFLYEHPDAKGRYIANSCDANIFDITKFLSEKYPEYNVPTKFKDIDEKDLEGVKFSSKKLMDLGFEFKYGLEDMYTQAIETCKAKGIPLPAAVAKKKPAN